MEKISGNVVTIGNFDGFHLGHQAIVENTIKIAENENLGTILITFQPNPKIFFKIEDQLIYSESQKIKSLNSSGIDRIEFLKFRDIYTMEGKEFIEHFLLKKYSMKYLVVGENFKLGKGRKWDIGRLKDVEDTYGFKVVVVNFEKLDNNKISSSMIRDLLRYGEVLTANLMLGKRYSIEGRVIHGRRTGRRLGFPTVNMVDKNCLLPNGVYKSEVKIKNITHRSGTYIGDNPTLKRSVRQIETNIFDFDDEIYNEDIEIIFIKMIRDEKKFISEEDLVTQIKDDINTIKFDFNSEF